MKVRKKSTVLNANLIDLEANNSFGQYEYYKNGLMEKLDPGEYYKITVPNTDEFFIISKTQFKTDYEEVCND